MTTVWPMQGLTGKRANVRSVTVPGKGRGDARSRAAVQLAWPTPAGAATECPGDEHLTQHPEMALHLLGRPLRGGLCGRSCLPRPPGDRASAVKPERAGSGP